MQLELEKSYNVEVIKISTKGLIVKLEDSSTELIHISRISNSFVHDLSEIFKLGDTFEAKGVIGKARAIELSLAHLNLITPNKAMNLITKDKRHPRTLTLDEMIDKCNADFKEKTKHMRFKVKSSRTN